MTFTQSARPSLHTTEESSRLFKVHRKRRSADSAMDELESSIDAMTIDTRSSWHFSKVTGMPSQKGSSNPPNHGSRQGEPKKHHESNSPLEVLNFARKSAAFYEVGRVFGHLLINRSNGTDLKFEGRMAQANGFHSRDFIVTRRSEDSFDAVPFHTHRTADAHHGKRRLLDENQEQLAVIHLEDEKPITLHENPITALEPIAVRPVQATRSVCQPSVIDFSKVIRFHYSGLVIDLGMVTERSMTHFEEYAKIHTRSEGTPHANESELGENRAFWDRWLPLGVVDRSGFEIADETSSKARRLMASQTTNSFLPIMETSQNSDTLLPIMEGETTSYWLNEALDDFDGRAPVPAPRAAPLLEPYAPYSHPPPPTAYMTHSYPPPAKSYPAYSFPPPPLPFWHEDMPYHIPGSEFV